MTLNLGRVGRVGRVYPTQECFDNEYNIIIGKMYPMLPKLPKNPEDLE